MLTKEVRRDKKPEWTAANITDRFTLTWSTSSYSSYLDLTKILLLVKL